MTPRQAARLRARIEARWPEASEVEVTAGDGGARVRMTMYGQDYEFGLADGGPLLRLLLTGSTEGWGS